MAELGKESEDVMFFMTSHTDLHTGGTALLLLLLLLRRRASRVALGLTPRRTWRAGCCRCGLRRAPSPTLLTLRRYGVDAVETTGVGRRVRAMAVEAQRAPTARLVVMLGAWGPLWGVRRVDPPRPAGFRPLAPRTAAGEVAGRLATRGRCGACPNALRCAQRESVVSTARGDVCRVGLRLAADGVVSGSQYMPRRWALGCTRRAGCGRVTPFVERRWMTRQPSAPSWSEHVFVFNPQVGSALFQEVVFVCGSQSLSSSLMCLRVCRK